jgi:hypothetical protein
MRFLNDVCRLQFTDANKFHDRTKSVYFHTSHPGLCAALRRDKHWVQVSQMMGGGNKGKSINRLAASREKSKTAVSMVNAGFGGHFRAVQGFKMPRQLAEDLQNA